MVLKNFYPQAANQKVATHLMKLGYQNGLNRLVVAPYSKQIYHALPLNTKNKFVLCTQHFIVKNISQHLKESTSVLDFLWTNVFLIIVYSNTLDQA